MSPELEQARRELETRLMWPYTFKSKLVAEFERLVRTETVEACAQAQCEWCAGKHKAGAAQWADPPGQWIHFRPTLGEYNTTEICKAQAIRALAPVEEEKRG